MILKDAWLVFLESYKSQKELERKRREFTDFSKQPLNMVRMEEMIKAAAAQAPGFYCIITLPNAKLEFGIKEKERADGETF